MNKYTQRHFVKLAEANQQEKRKAEDILPMQGGIPFIQDYFLSGMRANRSGRAKAMALASGTKEEDIPLSVKHPLTYGVLAGVGAGMAGTLAMKATDYAAASAAKNDLININRGNVGIYINGIKGVGALTAIGLVIAAHVNARRNLKQVSKKYDNTNSINPKKPEIGTRFLPLSGFADEGEMDAYRYMKGKTNLKPRMGMATNIASLVPLVGPITKPLAGLYNKQKAMDQQEEDK